ncbi:MAG: S-layer homology domain-containing protein [Erysipelotrichaceae bacterium]|nr:S-layer homology domain-containing protein [Erysipelotrichaceae bacterium]
MKKVLSLVLVIAMVLSSFSFAFAGTFEDVEGDYEKAIETLAALGVVDGYEDGTFRPENTITRAEMAKLMVVALGYGDLVAGSKSNFADTQGHWADPYIALAAGRGIVIGDPSGNFRPNDIVTYDEVYTMLVRALGYTDDCNELRGMTWPTNFKVKAAELGITKDVVMNTTGADRGGVVQAIFNALNATLVTVDSDGNVTLVVDRDENQVELFTRLADLNNNYVVNENVLDPNNKNYGGDLVDLAPYMFQSLKVYLNDDDEVVYVKGTNSLVYEGTIDDVTDNGTDTTIAIEDANGKIKKVKINGEEIDDLIDDIEVFENGKVKENSIAYEDLLNTETIKIVAMDDSDLLPNDANDNGKIEDVEIQGIVTTLRTRLVRIEKEYVDGKDSIDGIDLPLDSDDEVDFANLYISGDAEELDDIEIDDIVAVYAAEDNDVVTLVVTRNVVEGKVTKVADKDTVSVDGVSYDLSSKSLVGNWELELGDEGYFFLDQLGDIADFEGDSVGPTDYAVVIDSANGEAEARFGVSVGVYPELKLATQDGEEVVYEVLIELDRDGKVEDSVVINEDEFFVTDPETVYADEDPIAITGEFPTNQRWLIQYSLDSKGRIDEIKKIANVTDYETGNATADEIDLDKDELADGVVVFDGGDDFAVVDIDVLGKEFVAYAEEDKNGDIEVLVVNKGEVDDAASTIFAYLNKVTRTYNDDGDKVNVYTVYVDGVKKDILADDDSVAIDTYNYVISFDYNGDVIDESDVDPDLTGVVATATAINASKSRIQLDVPVGAEYFDGDTDVSLTDKYYRLSEHGTIVIVEEATVRYSVDKIADLYDIDEGDVVEVFFNTDGEIDLIVIGRLL